MNTSDRELLEAAYAAYRPGENYTRLVNDAGSDYWNPLTDDGDALRLAVKLGLLVDVWLQQKVCIASNQGEELVDAREQFGNDPYAATRRAIVRAAAEIGRSME
jgi:hypothetical protein